MNITGRVQNGVVVLNDGVTLPEGTRVIVTPLVALPPRSDRPRKRVQLPLIHSEQPGTIKLTNDQIAEILDAEDASVNGERPFEQSTPHPPFDKLGAPSPDGRRISE